MQSTRPALVWGSCMPKTACRQPTTMFFVEGDMEQEALRRHFSIKARKIGLYGDKVSTAAIARNILTSLIIESETKRVFIMFDRESRRESSKKIIDDLSRFLKRERPDIELMIAVPDRDIESWLFSDRESTSKRLRVKLGSKATFEGRKGVDQLAKYVGSGKYEKMKDGVRLFGEVSWNKIRRTSDSAKLSSLEGFFENCRWLD